MSPGAGRFLTRKKIVMQVSPAQPVITERTRVPRRAQSPPSAMAEPSSNAGAGQQGGECNARVLASRTKTSDIVTLRENVPGRRNEKSNEKTADGPQPLPGSCDKQLFGQE